MKITTYIKLSDCQADKVGNSLIYLSDKIAHLSNLKAIKLLYILDELSIKRSGIPFFNLKYKAWKFGPVSEEIFIDLSSETALLKDYVKMEAGEGTGLVKARKGFDDNEFSDNNIELLDFAVSQFGNKTEKELADYTRRINSPWHKTAKDNLALELLMNEEISRTELLVDMETLVSHDERKKAIYREFIEMN